MVQVDIFWSYGLSAGLALAAKKNLQNTSHWFFNKYCSLTLLWTALVFAPSGLYLLWTNPGWETMFVARDYSSLSAWLVAFFAVTNVTQGLLGFYVTYYFIKKGRDTAAAMQTIWSHLMMFIILIFGWDFTGYKRFFYAGSGDDWYQGVRYPLLDFFHCDIFYALLILAVVFIPSYFYLIRLFRKIS